MTERPLPALEALGEQFRRLDEAPRSRERLTGRTLLITLALVLLLAGVAAAAILITRGAALPAPNAKDLQSSGVPLPASVRLARLDVPDPAPGEPPWDIRLSRTRAGESCTAVGQVLDGQFGIVGLDHVFRALPLGGVDACGVGAPTGPVLAGARVFVGTGAQQARTVVNGIAGAGARSVTVYGPDGARSLRLGPQGSFITVYPGYVEEVRPRLAVVTGDGHRHTIAFAASSAFEVPDPAGGSPWEASGGPDLEGAAYPDENCAQASQELGRGNPSRFDTPLTPEICGRLGVSPLFVLMRRFVPGSGERTGFAWGNSAARTLVYGAAAPRVASLTLTGAGPARALPDRSARRGLPRRARRSRGSADAHANGTAARRQRARLRALDERLRVPLEPSARRTAGPRLSRPDSPEPGLRFAPLDVPVANTVRETVRASDPAGGPEWVLRSWQGPPNSRASFGGRPPARFICLQVGVKENHRFVEPRPGSSPLPLYVGEEYGTGGGCNSPSDLTRFGPLAQAVSYLDDPYAYAPVPLRTVISGWLRLDASDPCCSAPALPVRLTRRESRLHDGAARPLLGRAAADLGQDRRENHLRKCRAVLPGSSGAGNAAGAGARSERWSAVGIRGRHRRLDRLWTDPPGPFAAIEERTGTLQYSPEGWSGGGPLGFRAGAPPSASTFRAAKRASCRGTRPRPCRPPRSSDARCPVARSSRGSPEPTWSRSRW